MGDLYFFFKTIIMTAVFVLLLQIKIGDSTLEQRSMIWIQNSIVVDNLRSVASGAVKALSHGFRGVKSVFDTNMSRIFGSENEPAARISKFTFSRSEGALRAQDERRKRERVEKNRRKLLDDLDREEQDFSDSGEDALE